MLAESRDNNRLALNLLQISIIVSTDSNVVRSPASTLFFNVSPTKKLKELSLEKDDKPSSKFITPA
jgi:hypothetical protein